MRLLLALVYVGFGVWLYFQLGGAELPSYIGIAFGLFLMFSSVIVCNKGFLRRIRGISDKEHVENLIAKGIAKVESYKISKAVTFEDLNTGCLCHILNIGDNKAMCLYGQYLFEYSEILDDKDMNQKRKFPTDTLTIVRDVKNGEILRLDLGHKVIDEYKVLNPKLDSLYDLGFRLKDGEIIYDVRFEAVLEACGRVQN